MKKTQYILYATGECEHLFRRARRNVSHRYNHF
jgi:hypothetical protein